MPRIFEKKIEYTPVRFKEEHDAGSLKERYFMYPHFIDGVLTGSYRELSRTEIETIVQEHFFSFEPLIELTQEQEDLIRDQVIDHLFGALNCNRHKSLCGPVLYDGQGIVYGGVVEKGPLKKDALKLLSPREKVDLYFNPNNWRRLRYHEGSTTMPLPYYGNRDLVGPYDEYFSSAKEFADLMASLRGKTGAEKLAILDIGCGMGKALEDMKKIDPNIETHGITQEQEPAMFNADFFHYISAERFPADFGNKFHFINSQISFRYFLFQHIALRNVLLSLATGGFSRLGFSYESKHDTEGVEEYFRRLVPGAKNGYEAMKILLDYEMAKLDDLQRRGTITYTTSKRFREHGNQGYLGIEKLKDFDEEDLRIITSR